MKKSAQKQKVLTQRLDAGRANSATASPPPILSAVNSRGVEFKVGDRVTIRGSFDTANIQSFQSPLAAVLDDEESFTVVHVDILSHYVALPVAPTPKTSQSASVPISPSSAPVADRQNVLMEEGPMEDTPPSKKPERTVGRPWVQADGPFSIVHITNGTAADYLLEVIAPDLFRLTKLRARAAAAYTVQIGRTRSCGCDGFRSHKRCKHVDAIEALRASKRI